MQPSSNYGPLTASAAGIIMKELVRRAIAAVRAERFAFEVQGKVGYDGASEDMVTSADTRAQAGYLRSLRECFPDFGIVGEEDNLRVPCQLDGVEAYFTLDPVDGTKALVRRQSHGIGTMISLVINGQVVSAWVGDIMTQEVYGYRPESEKVHRISEMDVAEHLVFNSSKDLSTRHVLLHDPLHEYSKFSRSLITGGEAFKAYEVMGGSVGIWLARLWKGEVGAAALPPSHETPWDHAPILGISEQMGFRFVEIDPSGMMEVTSPKVDLNQIAYRDRDVFIVHQDHLEQFLRHSA